MQVIGPSSERSWFAALSWLVRRVESSQVRESVIKRKENGNPHLAQDYLRDPKKDPEQTDFGGNVLCKAKQYEICTEYIPSEIGREEGIVTCVLMHTRGGRGTWIDGLMVWWFDGNNSVLFIIVVIWSDVGQQMQWSGSKIWWNFGELRMTEWLND